MTNKDECAIMAGGFDTVPSAASETLANAWDIFKYNNDAGMREIENKAAPRDDFLSLEKEYLELRSIFVSTIGKYESEMMEVYSAIAPLLGLKPFYGTCNKEQVIWAISQEEASSLPAGANIFDFVRRAICERNLTKG